MLASSLSTERRRCRGGRPAVQRRSRRIGRRRASWRRLCSTIATRLPPTGCRARKPANGSCALARRALFEHCCRAASEGAIVGRDRLLIARTDAIADRRKSRARRPARRTIPRRGSGAAGSARGRSAGADPAIGRRAASRLLIREHVLVKLDAMLFHKDCLQQLKEEVGRLKAKGAGAAWTLARSRRGTGSRGSLRSLCWNGSIGSGSPAGSAT